MNERPVVLVAEDDEDILLLVTTRLSREGWDVVVARDGAQALSVATARHPAVAVIDIGMPKVDGLEVLRRIRDDARLADTRVLLLTAKAQESDVRRGYEAGADAYMRKPFSPGELAAAVAELLGDQSTDGGGS